MNFGLKLGIAVIRGSNGYVSASNAVKHEFFKLDILLRRS
jgi:hypothetical protein